MRFPFPGFRSINTESVIEMKLKFLEQYKHLGKEIYILFLGTNRNKYGLAYLAAADFDS